MSSANFKENPRFFSTPECGRIQSSAYTKKGLGLALKMEYFPDIEIWVWLGSHLGRIWGHLIARTALPFRARFPDDVKSRQI